MNKNLLPFFLGFACCFMLAVGGSQPTFEDLWVTNSLVVGDEATMSMAMMPMGIVFSDGGDPVFALVKRENGLSLAHIIDGHIAKIATWNDGETNLHGPVQFNDGLIVKGVAVVGDADRFVAISPRSINFHDGEADFILMVKNGDLVLFSPDSDGDGVAEVHERWPK